MTGLHGLGNICHHGRCADHSACSGKRTIGHGTATAQRQVPDHLWTLASRQVRSRRDHGLPGAGALRQLTHKVSTEYALAKTARAAHRPLVASLVAEPSTDRVVPLVEALGPLEAAYYSDENRVVDRVGKSEVLQQALEEKYAFVGGGLSEYIKYFNPEDRPRPCGARQRRLG